MALPWGIRSTVTALISQGFVRNPDHFEFLDNSATLNICESVKEIGEMAFVTTAWSSRGQTVKPMCLRFGVGRKGEGGHGEGGRAGHE